MKKTIESTCWLTSVLGALALTSTGHAQVRFSVNDTSALIGQTTPDGAGPIAGGDVLRPSTADQMPAPGPLALPELSSSGSMVGELDALSHGRDALLNAALLPSCSVWFSVGTGSLGMPGMPALAPTVSSENTGGGSNEAVADIFCDLGLIGMLPAAPLAPGGPSRHIGLIDADGLAGASGVTTPGFGLAEPLTAGGAGDDIDAFDAVHDEPYDDANFYFSLDGPSAMAQGVSPADILLGSPGASVVYAPAVMLGLNATLDDVDALALWDDGDGLYEPPVETFGFGPDADMILFSVTRQSDVVGRIDSLQGIQIVPGDILAPPLMGGQRPRVIIAAERLGLRTLRVNAAFNDELDALDLSFKPLFDCDATGAEDACEIASGLTIDGNQDGVPDGCGATLTTYCTGTLHAGGCIASVDWTGLPTLSGADDFHVLAKDVLNNRPGLMFWGLGSAAIPLQGGILCVQPPLKRMPVQFSAGNIGPDDCSGGFDQHLSQADLTALGVASGDDIFAQYWFRDLTQPFGVAFSTALQASVQP